MSDVLVWYVAGPVFGLLVVAMYVVANRRLGVSGSYLHLGFALRGHASERWRLLFLGGLLAGAAAAAAARGQLARPPTTASSARSCRASCSVRSWSVPGL